MKFRKRPEYVEAITFDELIEHGKKHADSMVDGVPWSFEYNHTRITHEADDIYMLPYYPENRDKYTQPMIVRGDMIVTDADGFVFAMSANEFYAEYEACE